VRDAPARIRTRTAELVDQSRFAQTGIAGDENHPASRRAGFEAPLFEIRKLDPSSNKRATENRANDHRNVLIGALPGRRLE
jgi:hypothetical protein